MTILARGNAAARTRRIALGLGVLTVSLIATSARAEPPVQSQQDAVCRDVARSRVFSAPDPLNVGLREIGRQIYVACMGKVGRPHGKRHGRSRRHRR